VLVPVLSFLAAALIMSCGGGSSGSAPVAESFRSLVGLNVCLGPPPTTTPKPTPTNGHTPKATPTPICTPIVASAIIDGIVPGTNQLQLNAQGIFNIQNTSSKEKFNDVTNSSSTLWNPIAPTVNFPGFISYQGNGLFIGVIPGCTYFTVSDGGFSQSVSVLVGNATPTPTPAPGATPTSVTSTDPTPTPTPCPTPPGSP
jgi:hypothetical protein